MMIPGAVLPEEEDEGERWWSRDGRRELLWEKTRSFPMTGGGTGGGGDLGSADSLG